MPEFWMMMGTLFISLQLQLSKYATELIPSANTTTFLNNGFSVEFTCSGVGLYVNWLVDGQSTHSISITQRGIVVTDLPLIDQNVISKLTIQTTAVNNNTKVQCAVVDTSLNAALSAPVWLSLQGTLDAPFEFRIDVNYTSRIVLCQWTAPFSLTISKSSGALQYVLCTNISGLQCKNFTVSCQSRQLCSAALNDSTAIFNMSTRAIQFSLYAINGAGNGKTATFLFTWDQLNSTIGSGNSDFPFLIVTLVVTLTTAAVLLIGIALIILKFTSIIYCTK